MSSDDAKLDQGPVWFYYTRAPGSGYMDLLGETIPPASAGAETLRAPSDTGRLASAQRSARQVFIWPMHSRWCEPGRRPRRRREHSGEGKRVGGSADVRLSVVRIEERDPAALETSRRQWPVEIESGSVQQVAMGGRPAVELKLCVNARP